MCGGRGTRLGAGEKPLTSIGGRVLVDRVLTALAESQIDTTYATISPHSPETARRLRADPGVTTIETPGAGYVSDLKQALDALEPPVLTVVADLPLLSGALVDAILDRHTERSLAVCVPIGRKRALGVSVDETAIVAGEWLPSGLNVVERADTTQYKAIDSIRLAVNVNRPRDAMIGTRLLEVLGDGS